MVVPLTSSFSSSSELPRGRKKMNKKRRVKPRQILINYVLSWTLEDVLNHHLFKDKVETIPNTFSSVEQYLNSYRYPLLEEIHAEMNTGLENISQSTTCRILSVRKDRGYKRPQNLVHQIIFDGQYQPCWFDVIALLDARPTTSEDLNNPERLFVPGIVLGVDDKRGHRMLHVLTLKPMLAEEGEEKMIEPQFAVSLLNLFPSIRIWEALHGGNLGFIKEVASFESRVEDGCGICSQKAECLQKNDLHSFNLNESQLEAVMSSIETSKCDHRNSVKLIWGPPGTGKTKTVSIILFELLKMKCKTLTCAPTNTAIVEVTSRLMHITRDALQNGSYGLGDIVLLGNKDRLKIQDHDDLADVFLDNRIEVISQCTGSFAKWGSWVKTMISLLTDSYQLYLKYLESRKNTETVKGACCLFCVNSDQTDDPEDESLSIALRIGLFMRKQLGRFEKDMSFCIKCMCTHMPTSIVSVEMVDAMYRALELFKYVTLLLQDGSFTEQQVMKIFSGSESIQLTVSDVPSLRFLSTNRNECLEILKILTKVSIPTFVDDDAIGKFCLERACLSFCTASSSAKLRKIKKTKLVIIDEAAQLKECESAIPLQLPNVQHAILIGDELQLPAMVQSKISEGAGFGRSLFERLVSLGHKRHLLNVQYRMHPAISLFPNSKFYDKQISDAYSVQERSYTKHLLQGNMYGPYSFINMSYGREEFDDKHSRNNMIEVAVVSEIIENLFKATIANGQKVSVGVISPYNAQVAAISKKLGDKYVTHNDFSVSVRSVDGFQGGEEDVILISTVRSNDYGSIGFLANRQRTNVALTRARYCLWIIGDGQTLMNNNSVWRNIVLDAKGRGCYFNAEDDKRLSEVIIDSLVEHGQLIDLVRMKSLIFKGARWKVIFENNFWKSFVKIKGGVTRRNVVALLMKLASGWRGDRSRRKKPTATGTTSSPLLKQNNIDGVYKLVWTTDIVREDTKCTQVLKILNILAQEDIPRLAKKLDTIFGSYSVDKMSRCGYKCFEGTLEVPMSWEPHWVIKQRDGLKELSTGMASLSLGQEWNTTGMQNNSMVNTNQSCSNSITLPRRRRKGR